MDDEFKSRFESSKYRRGRARPLSEEEHRLWRAVVKDARPLSGGRIIPEPELPTSPALQPVPGNVARSAVQPKPMASIPRPRPTSSRHPAPTPAPPPLTGLDRRTSQKLARGQIAADARLDLHGFRQDEAHAALQRFLSRSRLEGLRCVLVITGKGESPFARHTLHSTRYHEASDHSGVLRAALPQWLSEPQFRTEVAGFQPAHPRHGGGGAFYIWLRKRR
jgi:DNA-nicking Smr family endonuclease